MISEVRGADGAQAVLLLVSEVPPTLIFTPVLCFFNRNQRPFNVMCDSNSRPIGHATRHDQPAGLTKGASARRLLTLGKVTEGWP